MELCQLVMCVCRLPSHRVTGQCQENDSEADDSVGDAAIAEGFPWAMASMASIPVRTFSEPSVSPIQSALYVIHFPGTSPACRTGQDGECQGAFETCYTAAPIKWPDCFIANIFLKQCTATSISTFCPQDDQIFGCRRVSHGSLYSEHSNLIHWKGQQFNAVFISSITFILRVRSFGSHTWHWKIHRLYCRWCSF